MPKYANMPQVQGAFAPRSSQIFLCLCLATRILHLMTQRLEKKKKRSKTHHLSSWAACFSSSQRMFWPFLLLQDLCNWSWIWVMHTSQTNFYFQSFLIKQMWCYSVQGFISDSINKTIIFIICYQTAELAGTQTKYDTNFPRKWATSVQQILAGLTVMLQLCFIMQFAFPGPH